LRTLQQQVRESAEETTAWDLCLPDRTTPVPRALAEDLVDRRVGLRALAYSRYPPDLEWRLASLCDTALLGLARRLFTDAEATLHDFERLLAVHGANSRMLVALAHLEGRPATKEAAYVAVATMLEAPDLAQHLAIRRLVRQAEGAEGTGEELAALAATGIPRVLRAVAANVRTPRSTLLQLRYTTGLPYAAQIRDLARHSLVRQAPWGGDAPTD